MKKGIIKNNIVLGVIVILLIAFTIYFYVCHNLYERERVSIENLVVINYNELDNYLVENKDAVFYVSTLDNNKNKKFEKKFKKFINDYSLNNSILYLDVTSELKNKKLYKEISNKYSVDVPYVIIFNNGNIKSIFNIKDNNFDMELLKKYFINEGVIDD